MQNEMDHTCIHTVNKLESVASEASVVECNCNLVFPIIPLLGLYHLLTY